MGSRQYVEAACRGPARGPRGSGCEFRLTVAGDRRMIPRLIFADRHPNVRTMSSVTHIEFLDTAPVAQWLRACVVAMGPGGGGSSG